MIYLDTSWLVKLYVDEPSAAAVRAIVADDVAIAVSELSYIEFHAALARRGREGSIAGRAAARLVSRFRSEWGDRTRIGMSDEVVTRAAALVSAHPLRSLDAIHLASALLVATHAPERMRFGAADARLLAAARTEGLAIAGPT